ncbi:hypothetical protein D3C80_529890 [compost metagenome]
MVAIHRLGKALPYPGKTPGGFAVDLANVIRLGPEPDAAGKGRFGNLPTEQRRGLGLALGTGVGDLQDVAEAVGIDLGIQFTVQAHPGHSQRVAVQLRGIALGMDTFHRKRCAKHRQARLVQWVAAAAGIEVNLDLQVAGLALRQQVDPRATGLGPVLNGQVVGSQGRGHCAQSKRAGEESFHQGHSGYSKGQGADATHLAAADQALAHWLTLAPAGFMLEPHFAYAMHLERGNRCQP